MCTDRWYQPARGRICVQTDDKRQIGAEYEYRRMAPASWGRIWYQPPRDRIFDKTDGTSQPGAEYVYIKVVPAS